MTLSVTVLGCSGSYSAVDAACSGYLVEGGGMRVVLDLGPGTLANLQRHVALTDLDAVVLSHSHPDHWVDLTGLRTALKYAYDTELPSLPVYGTSETRELAAALCSGIEPTFEWHDMADGMTFAVGGLSITLAQTEHYVETYAIRIDEPSSGKSLAYSADTGPGWSFDSLGSDIDLALCEATYATDDDAHGILHLSATQAGAMARAAGVERLVLTHLWPPTDPDRCLVLGSEAFGAPVVIARTNERYQL